MNIALLLENIYFMGGGERVASNMANYFTSVLNIDVSIICLSSEKNKAIFPLNEKIVIQFIGINDDRFFTKYFNRLKAILKLKAFFKKNDYDIIIGIGTYPNILLAITGARNKMKIIGCEHNSFTSVSFLWSKLRVVFYPKLESVVSLTQKDLSKLSALNNNVWVIPNSNSMLVKEYSKLNKKQILSIGRFSYQKGYDLMIEVIHKFCEIEKGWTFKIIGDGPLRNKIEKQIKKRGLSNWVKIFPPTTDIFPEYLSSSVFLLTSRYEGLPMVLLEAQALGLPMISFNCDTGPSDIITHGIDGYLIDCFQIDEMVNALLDLTSDHLRLKSFSSKAIENSKKFSDKIIYEKWQSLFQELLKE